MEDLTKDQLIERLFHALDDEVKYCIDSRVEVSEVSVEMLKVCQTRKVGESEALSKLASKAAD